MLGRERDKSFCSTFFHLRFLTCFWGVRQTNRYLSVAFSGLKIGMKFTSKTVFLPLFTTARTLFCLFFANAKLVKIFRIRKKYRLCLQAEGPYSSFRYIFHAIHLLVDIYEEYISFRCYKGKVIPSIERRRKKEFELLYIP